MTSDSKLPWFPFYVNDFETDENVQLMTNEQVGIYVKLLGKSWRQGSIPSDLGTLAKLCGVVDGVAMATLWPGIERCWQPHPEVQGRLVNPRLEQERLKQVRLSQAASENGARGAKSRWDKRKSRNSQAIATPSIRHSHPIDPPLADYSQSQSESQSEVTTVPPTPQEGEPGTGPGKATTKGKTLCPDPFPISDEMAQWFRQAIGEGVPRRIVELEHESFMRWTKSKRPRYYDWDSTWRNSMLRAAGRRDTPLGAYLFEHKIGPSKERHADRPPEPGDFQ